MRPFAIQSSSMVEHAAVNRVVVGSSPTSGANALQIRTFSVFFYLLNPQQVADYCFYQERTECVPYPG